jgi:hypothetical protein
MKSYNKSSTIAIIIPYFGVWPVWIDLYLYSCEQNSDLDWYFITDCEPKLQKKNVFFNYLSFENYCKQVSEKLKIDFKPSSAYKLCDLKPFYSYIHKNIVDNYEFWGYSDIDVIWGDIKSFYTDQLLDKYDVFSTHADRLSGHLSIIRNTDRYINLCFKIENWKIILEDNKNHAIDEIDFSRLLYPESKYIIKFYLKILRKLFNWRDAWVLYYNFMPLINGVLFTRTRKLYFKEQHTTPILSDDGLTCLHDADTWYYKNGKLTNNKTDKEYIYFHFMIYKKNSFRNECYWKDNFYTIPKNYNFNDGILINKMGFYSLLLN